MQLSSRTVLIPLAGDGGRPGMIALVQADGTPPGANAPQLKPQIADLHDAGLYQAGRVALGAIRRLGLRPRGLTPAQWLRPGLLASYLSITNATDVLGLAPENSASAELGLALGLIMHAAQSRDRIVIATGALSRDVDASHAAAGDVAVEPVGQIGRKIEALLASVETQKGAAYERRALLFLPVRTLTGDETLTVHDEGLARLAAAFLKQGVELDVAPVSSLREAVGKLGVTALASTPADRWLVGAAVTAVATLASLWLGQLWLDAPLELAFEPIELADGQKATSPVRAVYDTQAAAFVMRPSCLGAQKLPVYRIGESLALRAVLRNGRSLDRVLGDYHYAVIGVSERSGIKVFPPETFGRPAENGAAAKGLSLVIPVSGPAEKNKLIILARRLRPFDTRALRADLDAAIAGKDAAERINVAVSHLVGSAPGYLDYSFLTAEGDAKCEPN